VPQQADDTEAVFTYNNDDTISTVTDARDAVSTYSYDKRHLLTGINYSAPTGITPASNVVFAYDAARNRTSMTDGLGNTSYHYDQLSRLLSETRVFTNVGTFTLTYDYNLVGLLKKITDASNTTINYGYDHGGRLTAVTGSDILVGGVSTYASSFQYRAWGALKQVAIGTHTSSFTYNSVLRPTNFNISGGVVNQNYEYYGDGHLSFVHNTTDNNFDRAFFYDHVGRLTLAVSGGAARNDTGSIPMYEKFSHDAFDNVTDRNTDTWSDSYSDGASYTNHRRSGWGYDANGNVLTIDSRTYSYNAAGLLTSLGGQQWTPNGYVPITSASAFDGNGQKVREETPSGSTFVTYYLRSTVLGGAIIEELNSSGQKQIGYVYTPSGTALATQVPGLNEVRLKQVSPIGQSQYEFYTSAGSTGRQEFDPLGADIRLHSGPPGHSGDAGDIMSFGGPMGSRSGAIDNPGAGCTLDGVWVPCSMAFRLLGEGSAVQCPDNDCGPQTRYVITDEGKKIPFLTLPFMAFANGESGYYLPGWFGATPQAQAEAAPRLRALAAAGAQAGSLDSSFAPKAVDLSVLQNSLKTCIHKLWATFEMTSFKPTTAPNLKSKDHDQYNGVIGLKDVQTGTNFNITNDPTPPQEVQNEIIGDQSRGITYPTHPFWNYAYPNGDPTPRPGELRYPELFGQMTMIYVRVQIHETGAALSAIRDMYHPSPGKVTLSDGGLYKGTHGDDGPALEDCVGHTYYEQMGLTPVHYP
jgi:YD repeat-containing protein